MDLINFLIEAKKQTYANGNAKRVSPSRFGSKDYHYEKEIDNKKFVYHDTYFGGKKFIGEEVVYLGTDKPKWGMNYYGVTIDETLSEEVIDKVLRPALSNVGEDIAVLPVRGPSFFRSDKYTYTFKCEGTIENFIGIEEVFKNNTLIYSLRCHGGIID